MFGFLKWLLELLPKLYRWFFRFNIECEPSQQYESEKGFIVEIHCRSLAPGAVQIWRSDIRLEVVLDEGVVRERDKSKIMYAAKAQVFDSPHVLETHLKDLSYANVPAYVSVLTKSTPLWLLITVGGPNATNPSLRFLMDSVYRLFRIKMRKRWLWLRYLDVPVPHVSILAGNKKTKIIDERGKPNQ